MGLEGKPNHDMDLALSAELKPRLKWTTALHQRFIEAVAQLGGSERATPMWLMRVMGIPGLTLFHVKSHLQKYRLENNEHSGSHNGNEQEDCLESEIQSGGVMSHNMEETRTSQKSESLHITQALQLEMEVQNKFYEQIEVQRHLQLRIEAQGMYLQSILKKAQETLAGYHYSLEGQQNSETGRTKDYSLSSPLTSSASSKRKDGKRPSVQSSHKNQFDDIGLSRKISRKKRSESSISDESCVEQSVTTIPPPQHQQPSKLKKLGHSEEVEVNFKCRNGSSSSGVELDLNVAPPELFDEP